MAQEFKRTAFAMAAFDLAQRFKLRFLSEQIDTGTATLPNPTLLDMVAPDGLSTGGGTQALQHIRLVPERGPAILIGSANQKEQTAELRTHAYLVQQHAQRFGNQELPVPVAMYQPLMEKVAAFLEGEKLVVKTIDAAPAPAPAVEPPRKSGVNPLIVGTLVAALAVALLAVALLLRR